MRSTVGMFRAGFGHGGAQVYTGLGPAGEEGGPRVVSAPVGEVPAAARLQGGQGGGSAEKAWYRARCAKSGTPGVWRTCAGRTTHERGSLHHAVPHVRAHPVRTLPPHPGRRRRGGGRHPGDLPAPAQAPGPGCELRRGARVDLPRGHASASSVLAAFSRCLCRRRKVSWVASAAAASSPRMWRQQMRTGWARTCGTAW